MHMHACDVIDVVLCRISIRSQWIGSKQLMEPRMVNNTSYMKSALHQSALHLGHVDRELHIYATLYSLYTVGYFQVLTCI